MGFGRKRPKTGPREAGSTIKQPRVTCGRIHISRWIAAREIRIDLRISCARPGDVLMTSMISCQCRAVFVLGAFVAIPPCKCKLVVGGIIVCLFGKSELLREYRHTSITPREDLTHRAVARSLVFCRPSSLRHSARAQQQWAKTLICSRPRGASRFCLV